MQHFGIMLQSYNSNIKFTRVTIIAALKILNVIGFNVLS